MKLFQFLSSLFQTNKNKQTDAEVLLILKDGAATAVKTAKDFNCDLNYSDNSIKTVDTALKKLKIAFTNQKDLEAVALIFGLYVIEVFERNYGNGYLERKYSNQGPDDFPYRRGDNLIFPCLWCLDSLQYDDAEDIWSQYQLALSEEQIKN